jgi:hypothetical protein
MNITILDTPKTLRPVRTAKWFAGKETALGDYRRGKLHMPVKGDHPQWAAGYRETVAELAGTFGRDNITRMGGVL